MHCRFTATKDERSVFHSKMFPSLDQSIAEIPPLTFSKSSTVPYWLLLQLHVD